MDEAAAERIAKWRQWAHDEGLSTVHVSDAELIEAMRAEDSRPLSMTPDIADMTPRMWAEVYEECIHKGGRLDIEPLPGGKWRKRPKRERIKWRWSASAAAHVASWRGAALRVWPADGGHAWEVRAGKRTIGRWHAKAGMAKRIARVEANKAASERTGA